MPPNENKIVVTIRKVRAAFCFTMRRPRSNVPCETSNGRLSRANVLNSRSRLRSGANRVWCQRLKTYLFGILTLLAFFSTFAQARDAHEQARIDFLLSSVETAKGMTFIRNGSNYDGAAAAKHLRAKLNYGGERLKTAEDFIKYCATESSITHRKYQVRTADGTTTEAAAYFSSLLREFDQGQKH